MGFLGYQGGLLFNSYLISKDDSNILAYQKAVKGVYEFEKVILLVYILGTEKFRKESEWQGTEKL